MLFGEPQQVSMKACALLLVERRKEIVLQFGRERTNTSQHLLAVARQPDDVTAAILGIAAALDQSALLQLVE